MTNGRVLVLSQRNGRMQADFVTLVDSTGFETIGAALEGLGAVVEERFDSFEARRWVLSADGATVELHHDDAWGNLLVSTSAAGDEVVKRLARGLIKSLGSVPATTQEPREGAGERSEKLESVARQMAAHAMAELADPAAGERIADREERRGRHQTLVIEGFRAVRKPELARDVLLSGPGEMASYLKARDASRDGDVFRFARGAAEIRVEWPGGVDAVEIRNNGGTARVALASGALSSRAFEAALTSL